MPAHIVRSIIEGTHIAVYSSIKPGAVHRLELGNKAYELMSSCIGVIEYIQKAIELGERVRRGELAATGIRLGQLYAKAIREAYRWIGRGVHPDIIVPSITNALILSYADVDSVLEELGSVKRARSIFVSGSSWRDAREFINALKTVGSEDMATHIQDAGLTQPYAVAENISLAEVFNVLASIWPGFNAVNPRDETVFNHLRRLLEYSRDYMKTESAIVRLYIDLVKPRMPQWAASELEKAVEKNLMDTREGSKVLFNIDIRLRKEGACFDRFVPLLAAIAQLAVYEGLRIQA